MTIPIAAAECGARPRPGTGGYPQRARPDPATRAAGRSPPPWGAAYRARQGREVVSAPNDSRAWWDATTPGSAYVAITAAGGRGFGTRGTIESVGRTGAGRFVGAPGVRLQVSGNDTALLAWTGFDGTHFVVRAAPLDRGHVGARQQLSSAGGEAVLGDVATAGDGRALALWRSGVAGADPVPGQQPHLFGNVRAAAARTFGPAEAIGGDARTVLSAPTAVVHPQTRRPIAVFTDFAASQALVAVRPPTVP